MSDAPDSMILSREICGAAAAAQQAIAGLPPAAQITAACQIVAALILEHYRRPLQAAALEVAVDQILLRVTHKPQPAVAS